MFSWTDAASNKLQGSNVFTIAKRTVEGQDMLYQSMKLTNGIWVLAELRVQTGNPNYTVSTVLDVLEITLNSFHWETVTSRRYYTTRWGGKNNLKSLKSSSQEFLISEGHFYTASKKVQLLLIHCAQTELLCVYTNFQIFYCFLGGCNYTHHNN